MKLKKFLGVALALTMVGSVTPTFASEGDYFKLGTPYDITTGAAATEIVAGHKIAIPVDITSTTGKLTSYSTVAKYDSEILSPGFTYEDCTSAEATNLVALAGNNAANLSQDPNTGLYAAILGTYTVGFGKTYVGTQVTNTAYKLADDASASCVFSGWYHTTAVATTDDPECYLLFSVKQTVSADELNKSIIETVPSECQLQDTVNNKPSEKNIEGEAEKINACDGAFKIVVDGSQLPYWVQGVDVEIDGTTYQLDACVNAEGETEYSFPVRLTSAADEASVSVAIKAQVSDTEAGPATSLRDWGTVTVDMSGTATTYAANNIDLSK